MTRIADLLAAGRTLSYEFFPPKTPEGLQKLTDCIDDVGAIDPSFVSVTYGAGGANRDHTRDLVVEITGARPFPAMPHLTCIGHTTSDLRSMLADYAASGVHNVLALAGDPPADGSPAAGDFAYASDLVELASGFDAFSIGVAAFPEGHPRSASLGEDRRRLADKLSIADFGISQFFYRIDDYLRMRDDLARLGCDTPVLPGLMPMVNPSVVRRFAEMNAAWFPSELAGRISEAGEADGLTIAVEAAAELGAALLTEGAPGIHVYCLNRSDVALGVAERLRFTAI